MNSVRLVLHSPSARRVATLVAFFMGSQSALAAITLPPNQQMYAVFHGSVLGPSYLYRIDVATGIAKLIGDTQISGLQSLTASPQGTLYSWNFEVGLVTVNPNTGVATDVNPAIPADVNRTYQSIDFSPDGRLIGVFQIGSRNALYEISTTTGASTFIGEAPHPDENQEMRGIEFIGNRLVGVKWNVTNSAFVEINPATGAVAHVGFTGAASLNSMAQDSTGALYTMTSIGHTSPSIPHLLHRLDPITGAAIESFPIAVDTFHFGYSPRSLAVITVVPEPTSFALAASTLIGLLVTRKRKRAIEA